MKMTHKEQARRATMIAYRNRLTRDVKDAAGNAIIPQGRVQYTGGFPYKDVAHAAPFPNNNNRLRNKDSNELYGEHRRCWVEMFRLFDEAWQQFVEDYRRNNNAENSNQVA